MSNEAPRSGSSSSIELDVDSGARSGLGRPPTVSAASIRDAWEPAIQGYLAKHKGVNWQRRFCVLRGNLLLYFPRHEMYPDAEPKGVLDLDGATMEWSDAGWRASLNPLVATFANSSLTSPFIFVITRPSGVRWMFCADTADVSHLWMHAFLRTGSVRLAVGCIAPPVPPALDLSNSFIYKGRVIVGEPPKRVQHGGRTGFGVASTAGRDRAGSSGTIADELFPGQPTQRSSSRMSHRHSTTSAGLGGMLTALFGRRESAPPPPSQAAAPARQQEQAAPRAAGAGGGAGARVGAGTGAGQASPYSPPRAQGNGGQPSQAQAQAHPAAATPQTQATYGHVQAPPQQRAHTKNVNTDTQPQPTSAAAPSPAPTQHAAGAAPPTAPATAPPTAEPMKVCGRCAAHVRLQAQFCHRCGFKIPADAPLVGATPSHDTHAPAPPAHAPAASAGNGGARRDADDAVVALDDDEDAEQVYMGAVDRMLAEEMHSEDEDDELPDAPSHPVAHVEPAPGGREEIGQVEEEEGRREAVAL